MSEDDQRQACREHSIVILNALVQACRHRFVTAAALLEWQTPTVAAVARLGVRSPVDMWPLMAAYSLLCERYIASFWSPQRSLSRSPGDEPDERWCAYFYKQAIPALVDRDDVVRNILRAVGSLPCRSPQEAAQALCQTIEEMTLPDCLPGWAPV